jgi:hypothetical protein
MLDGYVADSLDRLAGAETARTENQWKS